jgi:hypothetical protein
VEECLVLDRCQTRVVQISTVHKVARLEEAVLG